MKKQVIILASMILISAVTFAQKTVRTGIPLIGDKAPSFTAESTKGTINFPLDYGNKWKVLFSHPADFTPVCSSEILELAQAQQEFSKLNVELVVVSTDALETHHSWKKSLESLRYRNRDPKPIRFPLVADQDLAVSRMYGMLHENTNNTKDVRGVFVLDPQNKIRAIYFYPMEIGRSTDELKRTIIALQTADKENVMTPANWNAGDDVMIQSLKSEAEASSITEDPTASQYKVAWYMFFKKMI